jgi:hypothetical protein
MYFLALSLQKNKLIDRAEDRKSMRPSAFFIFKKGSFYEEISNIIDNLFNAFWFCGMRAGG